MTTLPDRPNTALVVLDVQKGVVAEAHQRDAVVSNIALLVDRAREAGVPVVWVQHSDDRLEKGSEAVRGYDVTLVGAAHTTEDLTEWGTPPPDQVIAFTNLYWKYHQGDGRTAAVEGTKDVTFSGRTGSA